MLVQLLMDCTSKTNYGIRIKQQQYMEMYGTPQLPYLEHCYDVMLCTYMLGQNNLL